MENSPTVGAAVASVAGGVGTVVGVEVGVAVGVLVGCGVTSEVDVTSCGGVDVASGVLDATVGWVGKRSKVGWRTGEWLPGLASPLETGVVVASRV